MKILDKFLEDFGQFVKNVGHTLRDFDRNLDQFLKRFWSLYTKSSPSFTPKCPPPSTQSRFLLKSRLIIDRLIFNFLTKNNIISQNTLVIGLKCRKMYLLNNNAWFDRLSVSPIAHYYQVVFRLFRPIIIVF